MTVVRTIVVANQKGGVGKTTTVANLGAALSARGHKVCLIDLDPQAHLTMHFGIDPMSERAGMYDVLTADTSLAEAAVGIESNLTIIPSVIDLAAAEVELAGAVGREQILRDRIDAKPFAYEFILIDCPPSLGLLTLNALSAAREVLIPLQPHFLALQGLGQLLETVSLVRRRINPDLTVAGVVFCMFETGTRLAGEVVRDVKEFFASARGGETPWSDARVFQSQIRRNVKLAECPGYGTTISHYDPSSHGATDYNALSEEFLAAFASDSDSDAQVDADASAVCAPDASATSASDPVETLTGGGEDAPEHTETTETPAVPSPNAM